MAYLVTQKKINKGSRYGTCQRTLTQKKINKGSKYGTYQRT